MIFSALGEKGKKMPDIIIHDMTIDEFAEYDNGGVGYLIGTGRVDEVKHGHWEVVDETEPRRYGCSVCKKLSWTEYNYCPNCGARMDEEGEDANN